MSKKKIYAIIVIVIGIAMLFISHSIQKQVAQGKIQIAEAQETVDRGSSLFSLSPYAHEIGKEVTHSAQKKITEGQRKVEFYEQVASLLFIGGVMVIVIGLGGLGFCFTRKK